jgi:hypothetical protein
MFYFLKKVNILWKWKTRGCFIVDQVFPAQPNTK